MVSAKKSSKKRKDYKHDGATNLKTTAICSLIDASRDSSTRIENFLSPMSSKMTLVVSLAQASHISFCINGEVNKLFPGALSSKILAPSSLIFNQSINSRKFPLLEEVRDSSCPRKARPCNKRNLTTANITVSRPKYSSCCSLDI